MWDKLSAWYKTLRGRATLQFKFSLSYILVIAAVLILLNSYPVSYTHLTLPTKA